MKMVKTSLVSLVLVMSVAVWVFGQIPPRTVTEFYLTLPSSINGIEGTQDAEIRGFEDDFFFYSNERNESDASIHRYRKSLIKVEDIKNGYLRLESSDWKGWVEVALFKKADGSNLVAISQVRCSPTCTGGILLTTYKNGRSRNVTAQVFPDSSAAAGYYKLPRVGTSISLVCDSCSQGNRSTEFQWNKERFIKK